MFGTIFQMKAIFQKAIFQKAWKSPVTEARRRYGAQSGPVLTSCECFGAARNQIVRRAFALRAQAFISRHSLQLRSAPRRAFDSIARRWRDIQRLMGDVNERDESSGACRGWRIARYRCSIRARSGAVAGQSRRRRGGPGKLEAGIGDRSALASPLASSPLASPLINARVDHSRRDRPALRACFLRMIRKSGSRIFRKDHAYIQKNLCAQSQFLNFQDLSFQGVSVSIRHCTQRSGGQ